MEEMVMEVMSWEYDFGHFDREEAVEIVEEAVAAYEDDPEYYDDLDDAIEMIAHSRMYPED